MEPLFTAISGTIVGYTYCSVYNHQKIYRIENIHRLENERDYNKEQALKFADHKSTKRRYEIEAQVYQESINEEKETLKSHFKTFWTTSGGYIPDIEREASERWRAELGYD